MHIRKREIRKQCIHRCAPGAGKSSQPMGTATGNTAAMTATSKQGSGGIESMEFRKIRIADLIPASYNPRKKLKPGDKEYQKIKNSITEFGYVEPVIVNSDMTIIGDTSAYLFSLILAMRRSTASSLTLTSRRRRRSTSPSIRSRANGTRSCWLTLSLTCRIRILMCPSLALSRRRSSSYSIPSMTRK